jgi:hypothetical protein
VIAVPLVWIIIATPFSLLLGFFGSFLALFAALFACQCLFARITPPGHCPNCGYDLTGNVSGVCPECGEKVTLRETEPG